jgi:hypothetical protein
VEDCDWISALRYYRDGKLTFPGWRESLHGVEEMSFIAKDDEYQIERLVREVEGVNIPNSSCDPRVYSRLDCAISRRIEHGLDRVQCVHREASAGQERRSAPARLAHLGDRIPAQSENPRRLAPALPFDEYKPSNAAAKCRRYNEYDLKPSGPGGLQRGFRTAQRPHVDDIRLHRYT